MKSREEGMDFVRALVFCPNALLVGRYRNFRD
jgi:hypothetical protein